MDGKISPLLLSNFRYHIKRKALTFAKKQKGLPDIERLDLKSGFTPKNNENNVHDDIIVCGHSVNRVVEDNRELIYSNAQFRFHRKGAETEYQFYTWLENGRAAMISLYKMNERAADEKIVAFKQFIRSEVIRIIVDKYRPFKSEELRLTFLEAIASFDLSSFDEKSLMAGKEHIREIASRIYRGEKSESLGVAIPLSVAHIREIELRLLEILCNLTNKML